MRLLAAALIALVLLAGCATPDAYRDFHDRQDRRDGRVVGLTGANAFEPQRLTVEVGTTVTWINNDTVRHTVTFENLSYDETLDEVGESVNRTFTRPGVFDYRCKPHSTDYRNWGQMVGRVTVVEG